MEIIRLWKDLDYREDLTDEELATAPVHPAGLAALNGTDLERIAGAGTEPLYTVGCCGPLQTFTNPPLAPCLITVNICW